MPQNLHRWYLGGANSKSTLTFLKFRFQNSFLGKLGPKKGKLSILPENWHTSYLEDDYSYSNISFLNLQLQIHFWANLGHKGQSCLSCLKIDTWSMMRMLILIPTLIFSISNPKSIFRQIWAEKVKIIMFMILFPSNRLHYCNFGHCVPYVVLMFCELVMLYKISQNCSFYLKIGRASRG